MTKSTNPLVAAATKQSDSLARMPGYMRSLDELKVEINAGYANGLSLAQRATEQMIEVGKLLLDAREKFKGDKEFGNWRKKNVEFSATNASRLMAVAREFGEVQDAYLLPLSTLSELLPASARLKDEVITETKEGSGPSVRETRRRVQEERNSHQGVPIKDTPPPEPEVLDSAQQLADTAADKKEPSDEEPIDAEFAEVEESGKNVEWVSPSASKPKVVEKIGDPEQSLVDRITAEISHDFLGRLRVSNDSFIIFGLSPLFDGSINREVISVLYDHYCKNDLTPKLQKKLDEACADIKKMLYQ